MKISIKSYWLKLAMTLVSVTSLSALGLADEKKESSRERLLKEKRLSTISKTDVAVEGFESVEMFNAMSDRRHRSHH